MTIRTLLAAVLSLLILQNFCSSVRAEETNPAPAAVAGTNASPALADLKGLVDRINAKNMAAEGISTNLQENLLEFDQLLIKHKDAAVDERAEILFMKIKLCLEVLHDLPKALVSLKEYQRQFPQFAINGDTAKFIEDLERQAAAQKIRDSLVPGMPFPDFSVTDINGKPLSISSHKGKVVLVDFWATWCMPCVISIPEVLDAYKKYHTKGFEVIGISLDEDQQAMKRFIRSRELEWPQYNDGLKWGGKLVQQYGVQAIPTTYLLDKEGNIIGANLQGEDLEEAIRKALGITVNEAKSEPSKAPKS